MNLYNNQLFFALTTRQGDPGHETKINDIFTI